MRWDAQRERREMFSQLYTFAVRTFVPFGESVYQASIGNYQAAFESAFLEGSFMIAGGVIGKALSSGSRIATTSYRSSSMGYKATNPIRSVTPSWCFPPGTLILLADGSTKPIEDIVAGEFVLADDPEDSLEVDAYRVEGTVHNQTLRLIHVSVDFDGDGETDSVFRSTGLHPLWTQGSGWVNAEDIAVGDMLQDHYEDPIMVTEVSVVYAYSETHNLSVQGVNTFFIVVDGIPILV